MLTDLYRADIVVFSTLGILIYLVLSGAPKGYITVMSQISKLSLTNAAGEFPVLIKLSIPASVTPVSGVLETDIPADKKP